MRCLLLSGHDRDGWYFVKKNDFYYVIYGSSNTWTLNALRGEGAMVLTRKTLILAI